MAKRRSKYLGINAVSENEQQRQKASPELESYVQEILTLIEEINKNCDYALTAGYVADEFVINKKHVKRALAELGE